MRPGLPAEGGPPPPHGDPAPRRGGLGRHCRRRRRRRRRRRLQPGPSSVPANGDNHRRVAKMYSGGHFIGDNIRGFGAAMGKSRRRGRCSGPVWRLDGTT